MLLNTYISHDVAIRMSVEELLGCLEKAVKNETILAYDNIGPTTSKIVLDNKEIDKAKALETISRIAERLM